ncbi:MAG: HEAT repeat domain-containing protein [Gemmatimonadales bacterium]|nr:HEAT repeat domain-containing protein [Gemmatimonadales bacterium]
MSEPVADIPEVLRRFAELVTLVSERPTAAVEQRTLVKEVVDAAKRAEGSLTLGADGTLATAAGPAEFPLLAKRFKGYGIEELTITGKAAVADLLDLARMLAAEPSGADPAGAFAGRSAVLDRRAIRLQLRPREASPPSAPLPTAPARPSRRETPVRRSSGSMPAVPPPDAAPAARATPAAPAPLQPQHSDEPERLERAIAVPTPSHRGLAAAVQALADAEREASAALPAALDELVQQVDLAFRQGRHADLVEGMAAIVALEHQALERDSSDTRRQLFNHALKRLTVRPMMLRQLAVLRHQLDADATASERLQAILHRYGVYGADALAHEYISAPTAESRAACLAALKRLRRTHDSLLGLARRTSVLDVREAATILGELRDARSEEILVEILRHPEPRARRAAVAALGGFTSLSSLDAIALLLQDEIASVRLRAVAALGARRDPRAVAMLAPLLDQEPNTEVLFSAIGAVGAAATPEAVQLLIRVAQGEGAHPNRRSAAMRVLACTALVAIRTPAAMAAVQMLRDDRDGEVREASMRLVAQASRRSTSASQAVVAQP